MTKKSSIISIIGKPNVGKSTLLNQLIGQKLSIVTPKVQTTRNVINGILTLKDVQLVFLDTPGIFAQKNKLDKMMVRYAWSSLVGADLVLLLLDSTQLLDTLSLEILQRLQQQKVQLD